MVQWDGFGRVGAVIPTRRPGDAGMRRMNIAPTSRGPSQLLDRTTDHSGPTTLAGRLMWVLNLGHLLSTDHILMYQNKSVIAGYFKVPLNKKHGCRDMK